MAWAGLAILALSLWQASVPPPQAESVSLALACGDKPHEVRVTFRNAGEADVAILLGRVLSNGPRYLPQELAVELRRRADAAPEPLVYMPPDLPRGFAAQIDHWVLPLPAQAVFTLAVRASDFVSTTGPLASGPPTELVVRLTGRAVTYDLNPAMSGMQQWKFWTGTAVSNALQINTCPR